MIRHIHCFIHSIESKNCKCARSVRSCGKKVLVEFADNLALAASAYRIVQYLC